MARRRRARRAASAVAPAATLARPSSMPACIQPFTRPSSSRGTACIASVSMPTSCTAAKSACATTTATTSPNCALQSSKASGTRAAAMASWQTTIQRLIETPRASPASSSGPTRNLSTQGRVASDVIVVIAASPMPSWRSRVGIAHQTNPTGAPSLRYSTANSQRRPRAVASRFGAGVPLTSPIR